MPLLKGFQRFCQSLAGCVVLFLVVWLLVQPPSFAQPVEDWANPRQEQYSWISDRAHLIPWTTEQHLNRRINQLKGRTGAELAIATLPQIETGQSAHEFAVNLFNAWGIGDRTANNGVLLLVSKADRRIEIVTGKGLEDILPDAEVGEVIQQEIAPAFQRQAYATGITQGTQAIAQRLEARLPSALFPKWMPASLGTALVWLPWLMVMVGAGVAIAGSFHAIRFSCTLVPVPVPTQGLNTETFASSGDSLSAYTFPKLLAHLFTPGDRDWASEIPTTALALVWLGGLVLGIGLIRGFWQFVLMHPDATIWQGDAVAWSLCALGSSGWLVWGSLVSSRFIQGQRFWQLLGWHLVLIGLVAALGGYIWVYRMPVWGTLVIVTLATASVGWLAWRILVGDDLRFKRQRSYCSDRTGDPVQELTAQELETVLTSAENQARSMGKLEFRGWREAHLAAPLSRAEVYLVRWSAPVAWVCRRCQSFAVEASTRSVEKKMEKTIESTKRINRKKKEKITSIIQVQQKVYTCYSCGFVDVYDQPQPGTGSRDSAIADNWGATSAYSPDSGTAHTNPYDTTYDSSYHQDYSDFSGGDFGGGSSDGGGAGSDW